MHKCFWKTMCHTTTKETQKLYGKEVNTYKKSKEFRCNIQPIDEKAIKYLFGMDIKGSYQMYTDIKLSVGDIIIYNNKTYSIEKIIAWHTYNVYSLLDADVEVL